MNNYTASRFGRYGAGNGVMAGPNNSGLTVTAGISGGVSGGDGTAPTAITLLAAVGFLVVFYIATRRIQGAL